jgi:hypothetical protein
MPWIIESCTEHRSSCDHGHDKRQCLEDQDWRLVCVDNGRMYFEKYFAVRPKVLLSCSAEEPKPLELEFEKVAL